MDDQQLIAQGYIPQGYFYVCPVCDTSTAFLAFTPPNTQEVDKTIKGLKKHVKVFHSQGRNVQEVWEEWQEVFPLEKHLHKKSERLLTLQDLVRKRQKEERESPVSTRI